QNIHIHGNHPHELPVIRPSIPQPFHQVEVVRAKNESSKIGTRHIFLVEIMFRLSVEFAITLLPRVFRISHPSDRRLPAQDLGVFDSKHFPVPPSPKTSCTLPPPVWPRRRR